MTRNQVTTIDHLSRKLAYLVTVMKIVIIGTGNVASLMGRLFKKAGHHILQVYGRTPEHAASLAAELQADFATDLHQINRDADIYIAAVSDQALAELAKHLKLPGKLVVHTAGSVSKQILQTVTDEYGVLYPLQSIRKEFAPVEPIPILVDASAPQVASRLLEIARSVSTNVAEVTDEERARLHVAAVFVNNFVNHLYTMAEQFCRDEALDFKLLLPLISETANRLHHIRPKDAVTGPAARRDEMTINKHLKLLSSYPLLQSAYSFLTEHMIATYKK